MQQAENFDPLCSQPKNILAIKRFDTSLTDFTEQTEKDNESRKKKKNRTKSKTRIKRSKTSPMLKSDREDGKKWKGVGRGWLARETVSGRQRQSSRGG